MISITTVSLFERDNLLKILEIPMQLFNLFNRSINNVFKRYAINHLLSHTNIVYLVKHHAGMLLRNPCIQL